MGSLRRKPGRKTWTAIYRDGDDIRREISTGCKSRDAARQVLADLEKRAEKVRTGIVSQQEAHALRWSSLPLDDHIAAHLEYMEGLRRSRHTVANRRWLINAVVTGCGWKRLNDLNRSKLENWLAGLVSDGMCARTRNAHAGAAIAFGNWLVRVGRLMVNPFAAIPMLNEKADRRRERRVLSMEEFGKLLEATEGRPLAEKSKNRGSEAELKPSTVDKLLWLGRSRAMAYRVLMFTGLRYGELRSITLGQVHLDAEVPHIELAAADEKARRGALVPMPAGLATPLLRYASERRKRLLGHCGSSVHVLPGALDNALLFDLPQKMVKVFDADLKAAGIEKSDTYGRTLDIHALRHSFCTMVAQSGINMQTAQRLMRHTTPAMTARYTHLTLTDLGSAIADLPPLPTTEQRDVMIACEKTPSESASTSRPTQRPIPPRTLGQERAFCCNHDTRGEPVGRAETKCANINASGAFRGVENGGRCKIRTCDPLRVKQVL